MNDTLVGLSTPCYDQRAEWRGGREEVLKTLRTEEKRGRWVTRTERKCGRREEVERVNKQKKMSMSKNGRKEKDGQQEGKR